MPKNDVANGGVASGHEGGESMGRQELRRLPWLSGLVWMVAGGAIAAAGLIGYNTLQVGDRLFASLGKFFTPAPAPPQVDVRSLIVQQLREASELTTATFTMQAVVPTQQDAAVGGIVFGTTKLLYIAYGEVQAGVDLAELKPTHIQTTERGVQVQLPAAQLVDQKIDVDRSQVYDYNRGFLGLGPDTGPALQSLAQREALQKIAAAACEEGILQKASDRAQLVVTQLLQAAGQQTVQVESPPTTVAACLTQARNFTGLPSAQPPGGASPTVNSPAESVPSADAP